MFFLTSPDTERLNVKGSRDPLGLVPLWGKFGRKVVHNLTTQSNTVRGFTTVLLGLYFAEQLAETSEDKEKTRLAAFLKFEQLAAYARWGCNQDTLIRGITQVKRRLEDGNGRRVRIGARTDFHILSNQKTYGLWGFYIIPGIDSGFIEKDSLTLEPPARELVEREYLPLMLAAGLKSEALLLQLLRKDHSDVDLGGQHAGLYEALAKVHAPTLRKLERQVYHEHLVSGGPKGASTWQPRFADLLQQHTPNSPEFGLIELASVIAGCNAEQDSDLRRHLENIRDLEALLVAVSNLFSFLQHRDSARLADVVAELRTAWGRGLRHIKPAVIEELRPKVADVFESAESGLRFVQLADALNQGDFQTAVELSVAHNKFVMESRNGSAAWINIADKKLDVRYADNVEKALLTPADLRVTWRSGYYINPLKAIAAQLA